VWREVNVFQGGNKAVHGSNGNSGGKKLMRIGSVCDQLKAEFPDISISKLRFLEEQELVRPERTPGGYRMYTEEHVVALRHVLRMQRDEFLPLKVIRAELQRRLSDPSAAASGPRRAVAAVPGAPPRVSLSAPDEIVSFEDLVARIQVSPEFIEECRQADLIAGRQTDKGGMGFTLHECGIVQSAWIMHRLGIDVRHLRQVHSALGNQSALVEQYAAARLRNPNPEQRAVAVKSVETLTQAMSDFMRLAFVRDVRAMTSRSLGVGTPAGTR
jgi:DNA-binding transcriptional MerR regulator